MSRIVFLMLLTAASATAFAEDIEQLRQEIEQLKMRVERLEVKAGVADEPKKTAPAAAPAPVSTAPGKVYTRYWISKNTAFDGKSETPLREGYMSLETRIKLDPELYGYNSTGFFDEHYDPSLYPVSAVSIEGELDIKQGGLYQLIIKPTPPREVGGAGNVEVSLEVTAGGEKLYSMPFSKKLASRQKEIRLKAGRQPLMIKIMARSPGFGPSQTNTEVYIGLQAEGSITPYPIKSYVATDQQN